MSSPLDQATARLLQHEREMERDLSEQVPRSGSGMRVRGEYPIFIVSTALGEDEATEGAEPADCIPISSAGFSTYPGSLSYGENFTVTGTYTGTVGAASEPVTIVWELWDELGAVIGTANSSSNSAGTFSASFTAPAYDVYMGIVGVFTNACGETTSSISIFVSP